MLRAFFRPRAIREAGHQLYLCVIGQARQPAFYRTLGVADRIDARFELYVLHTALVLERLNTAGEQGRETGQALFDTFVSQLDDTLRELGVGDLSVGKKMRRLGEQVYGRFSAYLTVEGSNSLRETLARNVYGEADAADADALAAYVGRARAHLAALPDSEVLAGRATWPAPIEEVAV